MAYKPTQQSEGEGHRSLEGWDHAWAQGENSKGRMKKLCTPDQRGTSILILAMAREARCRAPSLLPLRYQGGEGLILRSVASEECPSRTLEEQEDP
jgi:hypothetical protein